MTCREFTGFLDRYLDGSVDPVVRATFDEHLKVCRACGDYLRTYRDTIALARRSHMAADGPIPADVPDDLIRAVLAATGRAE